MNVSEQIAGFEQVNKRCVIAYGGDGTLLDVARKNGFKKAVFPVRDYGLCEEHQEALSVLFGKATKVPREIKQTLHPLLGFKLGSISDLAAAEVVVKNKDVTSCLRLDLLVNGKLYMENVICDGVIFATALGSHGYFKSVTRTIFSDDGLGVGFICPTYGINNLVLNMTDRLEVQFVRSTDVVVSADKQTFDRCHVEAGDMLEVCREAS